MSDPKGAERPTPETDAVWNTLDISDRARLSIKRLAVRSRDIERDRDQWRESSAGYASDLEQCREERDALAERVKEAERALQPQPIPDDLVPYGKRLETTRIHADYWLNGGRNESRRGHAVLAVEQAMNSWKGAAYSLAEKLELAESRLATLTDAARRLAEAKSLIARVAHQLKQGRDVHIRTFLAEDILALDAALEQGDAAAAAIERIGEET